MTYQRQTDSGVTLIEMLAALAVSAMIGIAGFTLLDSVTRTEFSVSGRLDKLKEQDRAFHLIVQDATSARQAEMQVAEELTLQFRSHTAVWSASDAGLIRRILFNDGSEIVQHILEEPARFASVEGHARIVELSLPRPELRRVFKIPAASSK